MAERQDERFIFDIKKRTLFANRATGISLVKTASK